MESNWFPVKLYFFLAHCALQVNLCRILFETWRKMQLCSELERMQYYSKSRVTSRSVSYSFLLPAHTDHKHTLSCAYIGCLQLPLPGSTFLSPQGAYTFAVATEILQRQAQQLLEHGCWTHAGQKKSPPCSGTENHISGANSQIQHPRHFLLDALLVAKLSSRLSSNIYKENHRMG